LNPLRRTSPRISPRLSGPAEPGTKVMSGKATDTQMFALKDPVPDRLTVRGSEYSLQRVFKHDFWAATCMYSTPDSDSDCPGIVVKFGRDHPFAGLPFQMVGRWLTSREEYIYHRLDGVDGIPRWIDRLSPSSCAIEYIEGKPLDHCEKPPGGFFDKLKTIFEDLHSRGVAYVDSNKRSNILVKENGDPALIDFQISLATNSTWFPPFRNILSSIVHSLQKKDIYHLLKHKRRMSPDELTPEEDLVSRKRRGVHFLHRKLAKPYRRMRRNFLRKRHEEGRLVSPTSELEDHVQPEKESWRDSPGE